MNDCFPEKKKLSPKEIKAASISYEAYVHSVVQKDYDTFLLETDRLKLIQQISQKLICKNYFHRLWHGKKNSCVIDAHVYLEDYTIEWIEQFIDYAAERNIDKIFLYE